MRINILSGPLLGLLIGGTVGANDAPVNFAREILPILSDKCFVCHGPDTKKETELRLDSPIAASADRGGYKAVNPDEPEASELLKRIFDREDPMPPLDADRQLTSGEKELLKRWILQGGKYSKHWAFVPPTRGAGRSIDYFVEGQLKGRKIGFAPEAERRTLARRAALMLTGLPPELEQLDRFLADDRADAYERLVDKLMEGSRFGEHQARYWLDAVRYGDTHGLHLDNRRGIYPYRDWVVRAFNENLPLNKFIEWQLAGDLLPEPSLDQLLATGFVRMNPTTGEGGAIEEEFQAKNNFDRVETLGTALLGASLVCVRCHTHKYDPFEQTEYYRMMAFFNSTAEPALDKNAYQYGPVVKAPKDASAWNEWQGICEARSGIVNRLPKSGQAMLAVHAKHTTAWKSSEWRMSKALGSEDQRPVEEDWSPVKGLPGKTADKLPKANQSRWLSCKISTPTDQTLWLSFASGAGQRVELDGEMIPDAGRLVPLVLSSGEHRLLIKLIGSQDRFLIEAHLSNAWGELADGTKWEDCDESHRLRMLADGDGPLLHGLEKKASEILRKATIAEADFTTSLVAKDLASPRETKLLTRGEYHLPTGDPLQPGIFAAMGAFPEAAPRNRLGLAQWLTSERHPLVARVLVNRMWQTAFGHALVRTPEEFGRQGEFPTHPELLDWLAVELRESGWDHKHLIRLMVTSRAFKQASVWRAEMDDPENRLFARGPRFRLDAEVLRDVGLWASGLLDPHVGGEGVKPYQPVGMWKALTHPASNTVNYEPDEGRKVYRRSLYVYWKRTSPHPMMSLFDAPSREASCVRRSRSNTPVQSLGLFNERQRLEMARKLAERLLHEKGTPQRLNLLFTLLASREPNVVERSSCLKLLRNMLKFYRENPEDAKALLAVGAAKSDEKLNADELAAWFQVAVTVMASDVAILVY